MGTSCRQMGRSKISVEMYREQQTFGMSTIPLILPDTPLRELLAWESTEDETLGQREVPVPIYEFLCGECGSFEERRSFEEAGNPAVCPGCGNTAQRVYSMPNLRTTLAAL